MKINKIMKDDIFYLELIQNEIKFLKQIDHPNIIQLKDFLKDKTYFYVIYELAEHGNLLNYYRKVQSFNEDDVFRIFFQVLLAVDCLHKKNIIHRNIKVF